MFFIQLCCYALNKILSFLRIIYIYNINIKKPENIKHKDHNLSDLYSHGFV